MIDLEAQRLRDDYLARLDAAIADLPWRIANELRMGIIEELDGLEVRRPTLEDVYLELTGE